MGCQCHSLMTQPSFLSIPFMLQPSFLPGSIMLQPSVLSVALKQLLLAQSFCLRLSLMHTEQLLSRKSAKLLRPCPCQKVDVFEVSIFVGTVKLSDLCISGRAASQQLRASLALRQQGRDQDADAGHG